MSKINRRSYPLRRILYTDVVHNEGIFDYLECGHKLPPAQDIYGTYHPKNRRCHKCAKEKEGE